VLLNARASGAMLDRIAKARISLRQFRFDWYSWSFLQVELVTYRTHMLSAQFLTIHIYDNTIVQVFYL